MSGVVVVGERDADERRVNGNEFEARVLQSRIARALLKSPVESDNGLEVLFRLALESGLDDTFSGVELRGTCRELERSAFAELPGGSSFQFCVCSGARRG